MSIRIQRDGRTIYDDDLAALAHAGNGIVSVRGVLDQLHLIAALPAMYGSASLAAKGAINLISELARDSGLTVPELEQGVIPVR